MSTPVQPEKLTTFGLVGPVARAVPGYAEISKREWRQAIARPDLSARCFARLARFISRRLGSVGLRDVTGPGARHQLLSRARTLGSLVPLGWHGRGSLNLL